MPRQALSNTSPANRTHRHRTPPTRDAGKPPPPRGQRRGTAGYSATPLRCAWTTQPLHFHPVFHAVVFTHQLETDPGNLLQPQPLSSRENSLYRTRKVGLQTPFCSAISGRREGNPRGWSEVVCSVGTQLVKAGRTPIVSGIKRFMFMLLVFFKSSGQTEVSSWKRLWLQPSLSSPQGFWRARRPTSAKRG